MSAEVNEPTYGGVRVNDKRIVEALKTMKKRGISKETAARLSGMPHEVVDKHYRETK